MADSNEDFLRSVELSTINPPPNWIGFTLKNFGSPREGNLSLQGVFSSQFRANCVTQYPNGGLYLYAGGFPDDASRRAALDFLRKIKVSRPQMEIVFTEGQKSPGLIGLAREGVRAAWRQICDL